MACILMQLIGFVLSKAKKSSESKIKIYFVNLLYWYSIGFITCFTLQKIGVQSSYRNGIYDCSDESRLKVRSQVMLFQHRQFRCCHLQGLPHLGVPTVPFPYQPMIILYIMIIEMTMFSRNDLSWHLNGRCPNICSNSMLCFRELEAWQLSVFFLKLT